jgi:hypothetical protein
MAYCLDMLGEISPYQVRKYKVSGGGKPYLMGPLKIWYQFTLNIDGQKTLSFYTNLQRVL